MAKAKQQARCPNCERLSQELNQIKARVAELEAELAKARKHSGNSSKPPSSDIVKPPRSAAPKGRKKKRRRGGQRGHQRNTRSPFPAEQVDHTWTYYWPEGSLGPEWEPLDEYRVVQEVELAKKLFEVTEHRAQLYRSRLTGETLAAPLPQEVLSAGLVGPRLSALIAYQKGVCHMSYTLIRRCLDDVLGLPLSRGYLAKVVQKASAALGPCHEELGTALPDQDVLNVDETGHPEEKRKLWTWGFHAPGSAGFTWFHIDPSRSSEVLKQFLGETFEGVVGCDYHSAYRKFFRETDALLQFCWAHLIRDVKYLTTLTDAVTRRFGEKLLAKIKVLFRTWHRRDELSPEQWKRQAGKAQRDIIKAARRAPRRSEAQNIAERFRQHGPEYFTFAEVSGVEPTNNAMERQFRQIVIDRKITQGTRGEAGRRWCERIWTVVTTCSQQGRSAFAFLCQSMSAYFTGRQPPSLLPQPP